jgi:hypothetical protein
MPDDAAGQACRLIFGNTNENASVMLAFLFGAD